jgi:hydroxyacylglutathione hydrolase
MALELVTIRCLSDNYAFLLHDAVSGQTAVVDVPDPAPILATLTARGWALTDILITHHHDDHIQGVDALRRATGARVTGAAADAHRLPALDVVVRPGDTFKVGADAFRVIDVPGHTVGHVAFHSATAGLAFTADSLMAAGCGRLFEGTPAQMWDSLTALMALPDDTVICSGHDYLDGNLRFAQSVDPDNRALADRVAKVAVLRSTGQEPMPWTLAEERATNPFLRAADPAIRHRLDMPDATDDAVFAELRARKDRF